MENELRLVISLFENKINEVEEDYKKKHKDNLEKEKMNKYVNRKLKKEIAILNYVNIVPSVNILRYAERFKY